MFSRIKIRPKIILILTFTAILTLGIMGYLSFTIGVDTLETNAFDQLTAVREMKASQIEDYVQQISDQIMTFSEDKMIIDAMKTFEQTHENIVSELDLSDFTRVEWDTTLRNYYQDEYLKRLIPNLMVDVSVDAYWPQESHSLLMQSLYLSNNPNETGAKDNLVNPGDGTSYSAAHEIYHPIIRDYLYAFGYYDIFLVDVESGGHIVYSVFKEVDFGTSLIDGPYSDTNFGRVYRAALEAEENDFVILEDFEPYHPSYNAPAAFIASPIFDGDEKIGVLIFQMPIDRINNIMTNNQSWESVGLGESGETYIVGEDFLMRNQSRFLIDDSENYFQILEDVGVSILTIARIKNLNSSIGLQAVQTEGTMAALSGETGTAVFPDYRGVPVFSAYKPLNIQGVNWVIMSEKDEAEVFLAIQELTTNMLLGVAGLFAVIIVISLVFSQNITRPILQLKETASKLADGDLDVACTIDSQDEIGDLAQSFEVMRVELKRSIDDLEAINQNLEGLVAERTQELELSERKSSSILESAGEGIIVIDHQSKILLWNKTAEKMFGYKKEEIIGESITAIVPERYLAQHTTALDQATERGKLAHPGVTHDISGKRKDGTAFPMELTVSQWEIAGETYYSGILRDITERKHLEEKIKESEERLKFALEGSNDGLWDWMIQKDEIYFSPRWETMLGYEPGEIEPTIGSWEKMVDPAYLAPVSKLMEDHLAGKEPVYEAEYPIRSKAGDWVWVLARGKVAEFDERGKPVRFVGTHVDISERKRLEERIQESEERLNFALEGSNDGLWDWDLQTNHVYLSPRWETMLGYEPGELEPNVSTLLNLIDTEYLGMVNKLLEDNLTGKKPLYAAEYPMRSKSGEWKWVLARGKIAKYNEGGEPVRFVGTHVDITERKELESQLHLQSSALMSAANGIGITDPQGEIQWVNSAFSKLTGYTLNELMGQSTRVLKSGKQDQAFYKDMWETINSGKVWHGELINKHKDGSLYPEEMTITPVRDEDGAVINFIAIKQDITERKEAEALIEKANERMSEELNFAKEIQLSLLPLIFPAFPTRSEFDIYAHLMAAREIGGDFYDFYFLGDDHLCFVIGDVSGKGAPGALLMAVSKTLIKSRAADDLQPSSILTHVNNELSVGNESAMFVTVFLAVLNIHTGKLVYCNAGHNPPYILRSDNTIDKMDDFHGPVIGALPNLTYKESSTTLRASDIIVFHTDGVTEAMNLEENLYSDQRYEDFLESEELNTPQKIVDLVIRDVKQFENGADQADDITMLALQYHGASDVKETGRLEIKIKNKLEGLAVVEEKFESFCEEHQIPDTARQKVSIVLDELLNNVINYAYKDQDEHIIELQFVLTGTRLVISIHDDGVPFNPFELDPPDISLSLDERAVGGLGIFFVRSMMDEYLYSRHIGKNVVRLVKLIDKE
jgi:PAS domain S-box-containing protein